MAVLTGAVEAVRLHLARGDQVDARDASGMTPFLLACGRNKVQVCQLLLDAGADPWLLTPAGATALDVAKAAGAAGAVELIQQLHANRNGRRQPRGDAPVIGREDEIDAPHTWEADVLDPDGWEPEREPVAPAVDPRVREELAAAQAVIGRHVPKDDSANWDDVDFVLPDRASLLLSPEDPESICRLRALFLRAVREGSVPEQLLSELTHTPEGEPDPDANRSLRLAIQDLGAECDERFEYVTPWEDFRVCLDPQERPGEEETVSDALAFLESLSAPANDPIRLYQREFARLRRLTSEEEVALGQAMEQGISTAFDSLANWAEGLQYIAGAVAKVRAGERPLRWLMADADDLSAMPHYNDGLLGVSAVARAAEETLQTMVDEGAGEDANDDDSDTAWALQTHASEDIEELTSLAAELQTLGTETIHEEAAALRLVRGLNLSRSMLVELLNVAGTKGCAPAKQFREAMATYLRARDAMVRGNVRLAHFHARKALPSGLDLADLTQEANLGLIRAADKFDWRRGYRFSTYATWWVRQHVYRAVANDGRLIRLPVHVYEKVQQVRRVARSLEEQSGRLPTHAEIAAQLAVSQERVAKWCRLDHEPESLDEVDLIGRMSLDAQDLHVVPDPSESLEKREAAARIDAVLSSLKPKEKQVLRMRFGLGGSEPMTLEEVGACFNVTRERARQIESAALKNLKHSSRREALADLVDQCSEEPLRGSHTAGGENLNVDSGEAGDMPASPMVRFSALQGVLELAARAGLVVEDECEGRVCVHLLTPRTAGERKVLRALLRLGFELRPGKGYWR